MYPKYCNQCEKPWEARKPDPVECPRCKRVDWNSPNKKANRHGNGVAVMSLEEECVAQTQQDEGEEPSFSGKAEQCPYKEHDGQSGEWMRCGLPVGHAKNRHGAWEQVG